MAKDINSDAMSNLLQGLTSDNEINTASSSSKKDDNVKSDKRKKPSGLCVNTDQTTSFYREIPGCQETRNTSRFLLPCCLVCEWVS